MSKKCYPWSHDWAKWELKDGFNKNMLTGKEINAKVQYRRCKKCGKHQVVGLN